MEFEIKITGEEVNIIGTSLVKMPYEVDEQTKKTSKSTKI